MTNAPLTAAFAQKSDSKGDTRPEGGLVSNESVSDGPSHPDIVREPQIPVPKAKTAWDSRAKQRETEPSQVATNPSPSTSVRKEWENIRQSAGGSSVKNMKAFWDRNKKVASSETAKEKIHCCS